MEKVLPYDRAYVKQETGWWCGPASTQTVLNSRGIFVPEPQLAQAIGTTVNGTNQIGMIAPILNSYLGGGYVVREADGDPMSQRMKDLLWSDIASSISAGFGVVVNIDAPVGNYPQGVNGSTSPAYSGGEVLHYIAVMGYTDQADVGRAVWVADSGFSPYGYWCSFDQLATLIPPKGWTANPVAQSVAPDDSAIWTDNLAQFMGPVA